MVLGPRAPCAARVSFLGLGTLATYVFAEATWSCNGSLSLNSHIQTRPSAPLGEPPPHTLHAHVRAHKHIQYNTTKT